MAGLRWEYVPTRKNKYLSNPPARLVFGGPALGVRGCGGGRDNAAAAALGALAGPGLDTGGEGQRNDLEAGGKSGCPAPRRRHQNDRRRYVRGVGASVARARADDAGS